MASKNYNVAVTYTRDGETKTTTVKTMASSTAAALRVGRAAFFRDFPRAAILNAEILWPDADPVQAEMAERASYGEANAVGPATCEEAGVKPLEEIQDDPPYWPSGTSLPTTRLEVELTGTPAQKLAAEVAEKRVSRGLRRPATYEEAEPFPEGSIVTTPTGKKGTVKGFDGTRYTVQLFGAPAYTVHLPRADLLKKNHDSAPPAERHLNALDAFLDVSGKQQTESERRRKVTQAAIDRSQGRAPKLETPKKKPVRERPVHSVGDAGSSPRAGRSRYAIDPAAIAAGSLPEKAPAVTSATNPRYQKIFDELHAAAKAGNWDIVKDYEITGSNSYSKMLRRYKADLIALRATMTAQRKGE